MIEIMGVTFKSLRSLMRLMGYNAVMSLAQINERHGNLENFVKKRLLITDKEQLKNALLKLKDKETGLNTGIDNVSTGASVDPVCIAVMRAIYQQIDQDKRSIIINTIAGLNSIDATELTNKIENFLK